LPRAKAAILRPAEELIDISIKPESTFSDPAEGLRAIAKILATVLAASGQAGRKQIVFGVGNPRAELMFIGEAPGADEDQARRALRGPRRPVA